jgi:hypothetical protein
MDLKTSVEKNPFTYLLTCMIATVTLTVGVQQYFANQQLNLLKAKQESEVQDLNSKLASFRRGIPGSEFFDIRNLLFSSSSKTNTPPSSSIFFPEQFYAPGGQGDWVYSETSELALGADLAGVSTVGIPAGIQKSMTLLKLHLWRAKNALPVEGNDYFKKLYPLVTVEKASSEQMRTLSGIPAPGEEASEKPAAPDAKQDLQKAIAKRDSNSQEFVDGVDRAFRNDMIGTYFAMQLQAQLRVAEQAPKLSITLIEIQKVGNVLYAQFLTTLKDVKVAGHPYAEYFVRREMILIATPEGAFIVGTSVPSGDPAPRDPSFAAVSKWLSEFRVVIP